MVRARDKLSKIVIHNAIVAQVGCITIDSETPSQNQSSHNNTGMCQTLSQELMLLKIVNLILNSARSDQAATLSWTEKRRYCSKLKRQKVPRYFSRSLQRHGKEFVQSHKRHGGRTSYF